MGRETKAVAEWRGESGAVTVLLESREIILRGEVKAKMQRSDIADITVDGDWLHLLINGEPLALQMNAGEAKKWATVLRRPAPSLASKLGISSDALAYLLGSTDDRELSEAIAGMTIENLADSSMIIAILNSESDLQNASQLAKINPLLPIWCVYPKGTRGSINGQMVRDHFRSIGYVDTKITAVSETLTATRYNRRREQ